MTAHAESIIGRQREVRKVLSHIRNRKSLHIYGAEGAGKTALLDWVYDNWGDTGVPLVPIYCRSSRTFRSILLYISLHFLDHFKHLESVDKFKRVNEIRYGTDLKKLSIRALKKMIFTYISQDNFCILLDHLDHVTPKINSFLTILYERALVISASRQSWEVDDYTFWGNLAYCLYLTPKLRVEQLSRRDTLLQMKHITGDAFETSTDLLDEIYRITRGNPRLTANIIAKALMPKYRVDGCINLKLIMLDLAIEDVPWE